MIPPLIITYTNHAGERRERRIIPRTMYYGTAPPWHVEPQWIIDALDVETGEYRAFAFDMIEPRKPT